MKKLLLGLFIFICFFQSFSQVHAEYNSGVGVNLPDLVITDFSWTPENAQKTVPLGKLHVYLTIKNIGNASVVLPENMRVSIYKDNVSYGGFGLGTAYYKLNQGDSQSFDFNTTQSPNILENSGSFDLVLVIDDAGGVNRYFSSGLIKESNENNNSITKKIIIGDTSSSSLPLLSSTEVGDVSSKGALLKATSVSSGNPTMTIRGICYTPSMAIISPSLTSGATCTASAMPLSNDWFGVYAMNLIPDTDYKFRGYATNSMGTGYSAEGNFTTKQLTSETPSISILSPVKSDIYKTGQQITVKWTSSNISDTSNLKLGLYVDIGDNYQLLFNANVLNNGSQVLNIPSDISVVGNYKIIIRTNNYDDYWESDSFKIVPSSDTNTTRMQIVTPNGDEKIVKGQKYNITWNSYGPQSGTNVYLTLKDDSINCVNDSVNGINMVITGCQSEFILTNDLTNIGTYTWDTNTKMSGPSTGPNSISVFNGDKFKIGVCGMTTGICDYSDNYFSISSSSAIDPVIFGVSGPQSLKINETGTWKISAYNQYGGDLFYQVKWGDEVSYNICNSSGISCTNSLVANQSQQSATFTHTYLKAGNYIPEFTVISENTIRCITTPCPSNKGSAKTTLTINVVDPSIICPLISQPASTFCTSGIIKSSFDNNGCLVKYFCSNDLENNCSSKEKICPNGNTVSSNCTTVPITQITCNGNTEAGSWNKILFYRTLRQGIQGDDVKALQEFLGITADGNFGRGTAAKVKAWQAEHGLKSDGLFGKGSRAKAGFND
jgi:peptidoglycan hydrolase-like protein with peptidoglycan-binding domain/archaellum component FlaF (FlaF/FlaG flagellin family)